MPEDPRPNPEPPDAVQRPPEPPKAGPQEDDVGDFINRHVFEKDSVFNEG
jgi:hypothetical protein